MAAAMATHIAASSLLHTNRLSFSHALNPAPKPFFSHLPLKPFHLRTHLSSSPLPARRRDRPLVSLDEAFPEDSGSEPEDEAFSEDSGSEPEEEEEEEVQVVGGREGAKPKWTTEEGKVFVGNLAFTVSTPDLKQLFGQAGEVVDAAVIYDKRTDRSRGFGFVTMATVEEANSAIDMFHLKEFHGRKLKVNFPEVPKGAEREVMNAKIQSTYKSFVNSPHKIYAGNLSWRVSSEDLKQAFSGQRGVLTAKVVFERETGRSRGFGFVSFETAEDADAAISALDGVDFEGRPLRLNLATERAAAPTF